MNFVFPLFLLFDELLPTEIIKTGGSIMPDNLKPLGNRSTLSQVISKVNELITVFNQSSNPSPTPHPQVGEYNLLDYGAKPGGDATTAFINAHKAIISSGKAGIIVIPGGDTYKITTNLTVDVAYVGIRAYGATLDTSSIKSGTAITVTGSVNSPYKQSTTVIEGFKLVGNGRGGKATGIRFHTEGGNGQGSSHITVRNINVSSFGIGLDYGNRAYLINHYGIDVYDCGVDINQSDNIVDGGEKLNFNGCVFYNSDLALRVKGDASSFIFQSCSFDYNTRQLDIYQSRVLMTNCHIEGYEYDAPPIKIDSDGYLDFNGGWFLMTKGLPHKTPYMVDLVDENSSCRIANSFVNNVKTATDYWATGKGQFILENIHSYVITQNPILLSKNQNLLADGGFEETEIKDNIFITDDTDPITNRLKGTNIELTTSSTIKRSGNRSLKANKTYGAYSGCAFIIVAPIPKPQATINASLFFNKPGTGAGSFSIRTGWATLAMNADGVPYLLHEEVRGDSAYDLTKNPSGWMQHTDNEPFRRSPFWATHYFIRCYMTVWDSGGNNAIYFDDVEINVVG
jgi:hypothetical protein